MPKTNNANPFEKYKATSVVNISGGWLTTKKRGRDDERIAHDAQLAINARKKSRARIRSKSTSKVKGGKKEKCRPSSVKRKSEAKSKQKKRLDYESDDSFIVSEEEEDYSEQDSEEEDFVEESDEEEDDIFDESENDSIEDDSSIEEASKLGPLRSNTKLSSFTKSDGGRTRTKSDRKGSVEKRKKTNSNENDESPGYVKDLMASPPKRVPNAHRNFDSSDDDDEIELLKSPPMSKKHDFSSTSSTSRYFQKRIDSSPALHMRSRSKQKHSKPSKIQLDDSDSEGEDFETSHRKHFSKSKPVRKSQPQAVINLSDTDEDIQDEIDEAIALSLVEEKSRKEHERLQKKASQRVKKQNEVVYKDDFEDEEERQRREEEEDVDDIEEVEEYRDENEIEANNVLATANSLSARILSIMTQWCQEENPDRSEDTTRTSDSSIPKGIILGGALSLSSLQMKGKDHELDGEEKKDDRERMSSIGASDAMWISNETMRKICPNIVLKDYQLIGVNWMALLNRLTFDVCNHDQLTPSLKGKDSGKGRGNVNGVLADEMGLGKTCQTIAFLAWLKYSKSFGNNEAVGGRKNVRNDDSKRKPHIIIVPASVLDNWMNEFKKFCPTMNVVKYHGTMTERQELKERLRQYLPKKKQVSKRGNFTKTLDVVVTTYSYFSSEKSDDRSFLRKFEWDYMVVDEAHCLKNPRGSRYKNMDCFTTERRLLLTGTPVQNSPKELMSLLCFLMPLFTRQASNFEEGNTNDGGERMLEHFVRIEALNGNGKSNANVSQEEAYQKLKQLFAPFVLRRSKDDLGRVLPPKTHEVEWVPFDDSVRKTYDSILENHLKSKARETQSNRNHLFTLLRKAANNALLLRTRHNSSEAKEHLSKILFTAGYFGRDATCTQALVKKELDSFSDYDIHCAALTLIEENRLLKGELEQYLLQEDDMYCSPKFIRLKELLPKLINEGHRILIFSQWTRCLDLLGCLMEALGLRFVRLDGQTSIPDRQNLIDEFNNDGSINVFLLSTRAGGMGINLTAADTCILHDLDFNPFNDLQAENRVHRFGQTKPVTIIKMVTENTVDADIYKMQQRKAKMNEAIMESKTVKDRKKEAEEVQAILKMAVSRYKTK